MTDDLRQPTVLLIEDHRDIAGAIVDFLEHRGFTIDYAADGVTGIALARTGRLKFLSGPPREREHYAAETRHFRGCK